MLYAGSDPSRPSLCVSQKTSLGGRDFVGSAAKSSASTSCATHLSWRSTSSLVRASIIRLVVPLACPGRDRARPQIPAEVLARRITDAALHFVYSLDVSKPLLIMPSAGLCGAGGDGRGQAAGSRSVVPACAVWH